jgi:hypothetical protein
MTSKLFIFQIELHFKCAKSKNRIEIFLGESYYQQSDSNYYSYQSKHIKSSFLQNIHKVPKHEQRTKKKKALAKEVHKHYNVK